MVVVSTPSDIDPDPFIYIERFYKPDYLDGLEFFLLAYHTKSKEEYIALINERVKRKEGILEVGFDTSLL